MYVQFRSDKILLAWLGTDADAFAQYLFKSLYLCLLLMPVCSPFCINCWRSTFLVSSHWLPSLPCVFFFIVFGWNPWSTCTLKIKEFLCVAQVKHCWCCPWITLWGESVTWPQHCCTLSPFESWGTSCTAELAGVTCTVTDDGALITAKASPGFL